MSSHRRAARWLPAFLVLAAASPFARSQDKSVDELERDVRGKYRVVLSELQSGTVEFDAKNPGHEAALKAEAEYLTRRFVDPVYRDAPPGSTDKSMDVLIKKVRTDVNLFTGVKKDKDNRAAAKVYVHHFVESAKEVILRNGERTPVTSLNLTRALASLAALGQGELADGLVEILDDDLKKDQLPEAERLSDPKKLPNDGVKYYALRGLRDLLARPQDTAPVLTKEQEEKVVRVLQRIITLNQTFKDGTPQAEIDGYRVRRREAVKALAQVTKPGVPDKPNGAAMTLLRVVARHGLSPEPTIDERLEAAVGLARLKFERDKDYNPDYAVSHLGRFLDEFASYCNSENEKYQRPVRTYAARLTEALESLKAELGKPAAARTAEEKKYTTEAIDQCVLVLGKLEKNGRVDKAGYTLDKWFADHKPVNAQLFKNLADTAVPPPGPKAGPKAME